MIAAPAKEHRTGFNVWLNGYRGLCAMFVFVHHAARANVIPLPGGTPLKDFTREFFMSLMYGVEMFFMISGFVILGSLLRHDRISGFLEDRAVRIFSAWVPAVIGVTAVCVALQVEAFRNVSFTEGMSIFFANLLLIPPLAPIPMVHSASWSLTYEWLFYFVAAAGALAYRRIPGHWWTYLVWIVPAAILICLFPRSLFFITGVLVFRYREWFAQHSRWLKYPLISLAIFLIAWRATGAGKAHLSVTMIDYVRDGRIVYALIALLASIHLFASVCVNASRQSSFLGSRTWQFLGNISYSFYLWHVLVMGAVKRVMGAVLPEMDPVIALVVFVIVSFAIALPISWLSWRLFEQRLAGALRSAFRNPGMLGRAARV